MILAALLFAAASGSLQADGAATPPAAPTLPYEDIGLCPFECCKYRTWTVEADTAIRTDRRDDSPIAFHVRRGEEVEGLTGVVVTTQLGQAMVRHRTTIGEGALVVTPGDPVYILSSIGEGFSKFWVRGRVDQGQIPGKADYCTGSDRRAVMDRPARPTECAIQITVEPVVVWWAKIRTRAGATGWTRELKNFGNMDACS